MTSLCDYMDHSEWTPEQRVSVALVETLRIKRSEDEQARDVLDWYDPKH